MTQRTRGRLSTEACDRRYLVYKRATESCMPETNKCGVQRVTKRYANGTNVEFQRVPRAFDTPKLRICLKGTNSGLPYLHFQLPIISVVVASRWPFRLEESIAWSWSILDIGLSPLPNKRIRDKTLHRAAWSKLLQTRRRDFSSSKVVSGSLVNCNPIQKRLIRVGYMKQTCMCENPV